MNDNLDDEERINLALNSDFDSALLNYFGEDDDQEDNDDMGGGTSDFLSVPARRSSLATTTGTAVASRAGDMSRLPSFVLNENEANTTENTSPGTSDPLVDPISCLPEPNDTSSVSSNARLIDASVAVPGTNGPNYYENLASSSKGQQPSAAAQMHPLAIQSSATCPPVASISNNNNSNGANAAQVGTGLTANNNAMGIPAMADPTMTTAALQAAFTASFMQHFNTNAGYNPALIPLAYNALAAGVDLSNFLPQFQPPTFPLPPGAFNAVDSPTEADSRGEHSNSASARAVTDSNASKSTGTKASKRKRSGQSSSNKRSRTSSGTAQQPPFLLFDAPVELRQNFIQSQRAHGMPVLEDNNSYHFGMTVNGFHPQRSLDEPYLYKSLSSSRPMPDPVPVVDARHADVGSKRLKNAKEQKRAHRISELIDQLRVKMEKGGWKVGIKSKFHTLSSCSDYVRHLIRQNEEKIAAVEKAKRDLAAKQEKMDEEKRTLQEPSEPESTTSSLTLSTQTEGVSKEKSPVQRLSSRNLASHESTVSSTSFSEDPKHRSVSLRPTSTVSDITDSNKGGATKKNDDTEQSGGTISSVAAVASQVKSPHRHRDMVVAVSRKRDPLNSNREDLKISEKTSLDGDFQLDYEEVFLKSNVPQILASTNGRIIAYNEFFLKLTGLARKEVESLTIFSLVHTSLLSNLFEIVAAALRSSDAEKDADTGEGIRKGVDSGDSTQGERKLAPLRDYAAITLPCVDFANVFGDGAAIRRRSEFSSARQLHMTVTLMTDSDVRKRCFHCAFTDCPGTKGALGSVTPELLSALFAKPGVKTKKGTEQKDFNS